MSPSSTAAVHRPVERVVAPDGELLAVARVVVGVALTMTCYCLVVVVPYVAGSAAVAQGRSAWQGGALWVAALLAVQVAPLVALVAGCWSLHRCVVAVRSRRSALAALAGASVALCSALAVLAAGPVGMAVLAVLLD